ncbi:hypothetical protein [Actinomadura rubteroloni]|nr:hypothetical protein [Actinomadura rubteroloni]
MVRELVGVLLRHSPSQKAAAERVGYSEAALSNWQHGGRLPSVKGLRVLFDEAMRGLAGESLPFGWNELATARADALGANSRARACQEAGLSVGAEQGNTGNTVPTARKANRAGVAARPVDQRVPATVAVEPARAPVPLRRGDRRPRPDASPSWAAFGTVRDRLARGQFTDVRVLLEHTAAAGSAEEVSAALTACRGGGLDDVADLLLHHAARRDKTFLLELIGWLTRIGRPDEITRLAGIAAELVPQGGKE